MSASTQSGTKRTLEIAHVLFLDIVAYSRMAMEEQEQVLRRLQEAVRTTNEVTRAQDADQLISLPTGDGMALVFFDDAEAPVRCALELNRSLKTEPAIQVRMGIHSGPVYRVADINANRNVTGGGINIAQRVMDCGDGGHILLSQAVAEVLCQLSAWKPAIHDLGEAEVKHGVKVHLYNLYTDEVGNREIPRKLYAGSRTNAPGRVQITPRKVTAVLVSLLILMVVAAWFAWRGGVTTKVWWRFHEKPVESMHIARLTGSGHVQLGAISPDGKYIVYALGDGKGQQGLVLKHVATAQEVNIVPMAETVITGLTFSHDSNYLYYVRNSRPNFRGVLYRVTVLGGIRKRS